MTGASPEAATGGRPEPLIPVLLALATAGLFFPALQNAFVLWDDDRMLVDNPFYRGLGWTQLRWMFTTFHAGHYMPLTWLTLGLDYLLSGMAPAGYHATNVALHAAGAAVFYGVAQRLLRHAAPTLDARLGGAFAALLFAVHPLRVESVAWATERRDVLSGLFYLLAILAYLRAHDAVRAAARRTQSRLCLAFFALALLSKSMAVSLPLVLLILDVYPLRRLGGSAGWVGPVARRVWGEKIPMLLLSAGAGTVAVVALVAHGDATALADLGWGGRIAVSLYALAFYLWTTAVPLGLSPLYELHRQTDFLGWPFMLSGAVAMTVTGAAVALRRRWPAFLAAWVSYVAILAPVLGIVHNGHQIAADRYTYLAGLGWALLGGGALAMGWRAATRRRGARGAVVLGVVALAVVAVLGGLTWRQIGVWRDSETLWTHALALDPRSALAHNNLGTVRAGQQRLDEAIALFRRAVELDPSYALAHRNWGAMLAERGQRSEAIERFQQALRVKPGYPAAHNDWGLALVHLNRPAEAIEHFREALRLRPDLATPHSNWGLALFAQRRLGEAIEHYREAIRLKPDHAEAHYNWGYALAEEGRFAEAIERFAEAVRSQPEHALAENDWGLALIRLGRYPEAIDHLHRALRRKPDFAIAHNNLGLAFMHLRNWREAIDHFEQALRLEPRLGLAHANWGLVLLEQGQAADALAHLDRALQLQPELARGLGAARARAAAALGGATPRARPLP